MKNQQWRECRTGHDRVVTFAGWVTLFMLLSWSMAGSAAVYRCRDSDGGVLYQRAPCAGGSEVELDTRTTEWVAAPTIRHGGRPDRSATRDRQAAALSRAAQAKARQEKACWRAEQRIDRIDRTLRKGYKPARGERLRQQRREQQAYLRRFCR